MIDAIATRAAARRDRWRRGLGGSLVVAIVACALLTACGGAPALSGTDLGGQPAPDFTLADQRGAAVRLDDFRGKAVVLTFIYTNCPDVCPATAEHLREAYAQLSPATRERVALLAVARERALAHSDLDPARLAADLQTLAG